MSSNSLSQWIWLVVSVVIFLTACDNDPAPRLDVTLEPSQIAANVRPLPTLTVTSPHPTPEPILLQGGSTATTAAEETTALPPTPSVEPTILNTPTAVPTSNAADLQSLIENPNLVVTTEMDTECFLAEDFTPFRLIVRSLETAPIYFYTKGKWQFSINNSPVGPQLESIVPSLRTDFVEIPPGEGYTREEEDLGLWVQSLGETATIPLSETGIGLPAGEYWITFVYSNDQDGLTKQVDDSYLIDRPAWQGTAVASELRFKVVSDLSQC